MNITMKYNVQQIGSEFSRYLPPLSVLNSQVEHEIDLFYIWSLNEIEELQRIMTKSFFCGIDKEDQMYFKELSDETYDWYQDEGKEMFLLFKQTLEPFALEEHQLKDLRESVIRLKGRWKDLKSDIEELEDFENLFNWLLDLPYLFKKRLEAFGMVLNSRSILSALIGAVGKNYELKNPITEASPLGACLSFMVKERCVN